MSVLWFSLRVRFKLSNVALILTSVAVAIIARPKALTNMMVCISMMFSLDLLERIPDPSALNYFMFDVEVWGFVHSVKHVSVVADHTVAVEKAILALICELVLFAG